MSRRWRGRFYSARPRPFKREAGLWTKGVSRLLRAKRRRLNRVRLRLSDQEGDICPKSSCILGIGDGLVRRRGLIDVILLIRSI